MILIENPITKEEKILNALFENLYGRSAFDWWWDDIEDDIKEEIVQSLLESIRVELNA